MSDLPAARSVCAAAPPLAAAGKLHFGMRVGSGHISNHSSHWLHSWPITEGKLGAKEQSLASSSVENRDMSARGFTKLEFHLVKFY